MLSLNIINSDSTLNSFNISGTKEFIGGEDIKLRMQLFQKDKGIRYIPDVAAVITLDLKLADETILVKTATFPFADDRSIIEINITDLESVDLISQTINVKINESGNITYAVLQFGLKRNKIVSGC